MALPHTRTPPRFPPVSPSNQGKSTSPRTESDQQTTRRRRWIAIGAAVIAALGVTSLFMFTEFNWAMLQDTITGLNPVLVFLLMATLPVGGFSVGAVYLVAGAKFGPLLGGALVAAATASHLLLTHWVARGFLRGSLERLLKRHHHRLLEIPPEEHGAISVMAALIPGLPYFVRNYLLALSGVPLRTYFWICLPIYVARSYVTIFLGNLGSDPSRTGLFVLIGVYVVKLSICAYLLRRLRRHYKQRQRSAVPAP